MTPRPRPRCERTGWLKPLDAAPLIAGDAKLQAIHERLTAQGYRPPATVRPYLGKGRRVTLRFVWKKRVKDTRYSHTVILRFQA